MSELGIFRRRASLARLLLCLVPFVAVIAGGTTSAAAAQPVSPKLLTTNPASSAIAPASSVTPSVLGEAEPEDGIIIESIRGYGAPQSWWTRSAVEKPTKHPEYEIQIFSGGECLGPPIAEGAAGALEEGGIAVGVPANAKTVMSARQTDPSAPGEPSRCSNSLSYWEGSVPSEETPGGGGGSSGGGSNGGGSESTTPGGGGSQSPGGSSSGGSVGNATAVGKRKPGAPAIHTNPGALANDLTPSVVGSAPGAGAVSVFADGNCSGSPIARGTPSQLSSGFEVSVAPNAPTTFSAMAFGEEHSNCSTPITYIEDSLAPRTRITMGPGVRTRKHRATFRFQDVTEDPPGTNFRCKVDKAKWQSCSSPFQVRHLKLGHHVLTVRATDLAGNVEPKPVKRQFIVVLPSAP